MIKMLLSLGNNICVLEVSIMGWRITLADLRWQLVIARSLNSCS